MDIKDYPGNSHKSRNTSPEEPKKIEKVIKGSVVTRKKTIGRRFIDLFLGDDVESVSSYIMYEVLIPAAKDTVFDMIRGGTEMLLFGDSRGSARQSRRSNGKAYVRYDRVSYRDEDRRRNVSQRSRARHNFDEIILDSYVEAEEVLNILIELIERYDMATVADLYELVGIERTHTDEKWGWENLAHSKITRVRGSGYLLDLPRPILLD